MSATLIFKVQT